MIIYNITVKVEAAIAQEWLHWLRETEAPEILATGCFYKYHILHLPEMDDAEGATYAIQYHARTTADYKTYITHFASCFQQQAAQKWGDHFVSFSTLMQVIA